MRAGSFNERITIRIADNPSGSVDNTGAPIAPTYTNMKRWANVKQRNQSGEDFLDEERIDSEIRHNVKIRWEKGISYDFLNGECIILFQGFEMNVLSWFINRPMGFVDITTKALVK